MGLLATLSFANAAPAPKKTTTKTTAGSKKSSTAAKKKTSTAKKGSKSKSRRSARRSWKSRGQQAMDAGRAREIQGKLIAAGYLSGEPTGKWDQRSQEAMRKYQEDNGWQTKILPDSRALIKLGLGPNHSSAINAAALGLDSGGN